eukprot:288031_1
MNKFPSIPHLPFSPQINEDDIISNDTSTFVTRHTSYKLCIHEKLDGGNCCIFNGNVYARTHKHPTKHPWFNTIKDMIRSQPLFYESQYSQLMIFGENMTAIHSIPYHNLTSYFYIFAVYDPSKTIWYSVHDVEDLAKKLNIPTAPLLFKGNFNSLKEIKDWMDKEIKKPSTMGSKHREGFVIRIDTAFPMNSFDKSIAKYVRKGHIQTDKNWTRTWKKASIIRTNSNTHKNKKNKSRKKTKIKPSLKTSLIVCCGLQGSGKSTFAKHLSEHREEWERAGTDLFNKNKNAVFDVIGRIAKNNQKKCIVENCNVTVAKRREILNCAFNPRDAICVYFDIDKQKCIERTQSRQNHQTKHLFKSAKGSRIISSFAKQLQIPTTKEGFKHVITVGCEGTNTINRLLSRLGVKEPIQSSYSASHQTENETSDEYKENDDKLEPIKTNRKRSKALLNRAKTGLYTALMATSRFTMSNKVLCKKLKLDINNILNVYVIGSRVWGTATSVSDWDVVIVTKTKNDRVFLSRDNVDAYILDECQWREELNNHRFVCWLTLFLPKEAIWKEELSICDINKERGVNKVNVDGFEFKRFVDALATEVDKDCKKLNKFYKKNKLDKVRRTFIHSARMIAVCKRIVFLLQQDYSERNKNGSGVDIKCESFRNVSLVGKIRFDGIEHKSIQKQKEIESSNEQSKTSDIWVKVLQDGAKECQSLIS